MTIGRPRRTGPRPPRGGVLLIQNVINGRTLVVGSREIRKRMSDHRQALRKGSHWNKRLQRDYNRTPMEFRLVIFKDGLHSVAVVRDCKREQVKRLAAKDLVYNRCPPFLTGGASVE